MVKMMGIFVVDPRGALPVLPLQTIAHHTVRLDIAALRDSDPHDGAVKSPR